MANPHADIPVRAPSATPVDDAVLPFQIAALDVRGRMVRLGPVVDEILARHDYPLPVARLLGEAIVMTVLLGTTIRMEGRFILQTKTDGPVWTLVVDFRSPNVVRACARFNPARVNAAIEAGKADAGSLLGRGHLAMTIDQGAERNRYQGLIALQGGSLEDAAHEYFKSSEQIPTRVRLAVGEEFSAGSVHRWRAGGILVQFLPRDPARARVPDLDPGDAPEGTPAHVVPEDDAWVEARSLIATVEDVELLDHALSSEQLVYRLFHEHEVRVFRNREIVARCSCSRPGVEAMLRSFPQDDRDHMVEDGMISVTCEFCSAKYRFTPEDVCDAPSSSVS
jgi:molecular chaperone Hsp33